MIDNFLTVLVHGVLLGEATDAVASTAMRKACEASLQKLTGELKHLTQPCNCESSAPQGKKVVKAKTSAGKGVPK